MKKIIYLDNNGTTKICKKSKEKIIAWLCCCTNPSSDSKLASKTKDMIDATKNYILKHNGIINNYTVLFTSGASESNSMIIKSVTESYKRHKKMIPHVIISAIEHKCIIECCKLLNSDGLITLTIIEPNAYGYISYMDVEKSINNNTALISIMYANNEIGSINDIKKIGSIAHKHNIPFHTDAVQIYGKIKINIFENNIDALSMSFHKMYGPMGLGMLILNNQLISGYQIKGQISGSQQHQLRGGTENVPGIAGIIPAIKDTFLNRNTKNSKMLKQKKRIVKELEKSITRGEYKTYFDKTEKKENEFVVIGNPDIEKEMLPNTLLIAFVKNINTSKPFCNVNLKKRLNSKNIIVSIGSACSTKDPDASHVLVAIKAPLKIKQGVIRISLSDNTIDKELDIFIKELIKSVVIQFNDV